MGESDIVEQEGTIYGIRSPGEDSALFYVPVPWDATVSYGAGASRGPAAILEASSQLDLFDLDVDRPYRAGMHLLDAPDWIPRTNERARRLVERARDGDRKALSEANALCDRMNAHVREECARVLSRGKRVAVIGGDHSVSLGAFQAAAEKEGRFGILHFDAHMDLRDAYQGFTSSHASIMRNVLEKVPGVSRLVQVGIRDFSGDEMEYARSQGDRAKIYFDQMLWDWRHDGKSWSSIADRIIGDLPEKVWVSFDIDGLDPAFCPHTGTPVPGGLSYPEAVTILRRLARSGRKIVGFDLVEVASPADPADDSSGQWDANVGMRLLYKLSALTLATLGIRPFREPA